LWLGLALVVIVTACLDSYGITTWPMADDEVPSLVEMGRFQVDAAAFSVPSNQLGRLPKAMPVWYGFQRGALALLPSNELGFRLPSLICAILTSAVAFVVAARWRGLWFGAALAVMVNGSQMFVFLSQIDRFYSMPLLLLTLTFCIVWMPGHDVLMGMVAGLLALLTALSHNITVAVFVLAFLAAGPAWLVGRIGKAPLLRTGIAALVSVALYVLYIRPIIHGWASTGNPTPTLVSFSAHSGIPTLALAILGGWLAVARPRDGSSMLWWSLLFVGSLCFIQIAPVSWNPRYFVFFMPAMWVLAAHAMESIARSVGYRSVGVVWYGCVVMLLLPGLLSHYQDGSRHDYRQAAAVLMTQARPGQLILSDDAETISYYLPADLRQTLQVRTKARELPQTEFFLVARSNAWTPLPQLRRRQSELLAEIYRRRFDEFSHILRVYRVSPADH
jgi:hypothetical protein